MMLSYKLPQRNRSNPSKRSKTTCSGPASPLRQLQVELHSLSVDQDNAIIHELLSRAIVRLIAAKGRKREEELDGESLCRGCARAGAKSDSGAEADPVKVLVTRKISESATNEG